MKEIILTRGQAALVDDDDFDYLSQWKWNAYRRDERCTYYAVRSCYEGGKKKTLRMHNVIFQRHNPTPYTELDHIDRNGLNNTKSNLRACTRSENLFNRRNFGALPKGIRLQKSTYTDSENKTRIYTKYQARINVNGRSIFLGNYSNLDDAINAYAEASEKYYPNYATYL